MSVSKHLSCKPSGTPAGGRLETKFTISNAPLVQDTTNPFVQETRNHSGDPCPKDFHLFEQKWQKWPNSNSRWRFLGTFLRTFLMISAVNYTPVRWNKIAHRCQVISARSSGRLWRFICLVPCQICGARFHSTLKLKWFSTCIIEFVIIWLFQQFSVRKKRFFSDCWLQSGVDKSSGGPVS